MDCIYAEFTVVEEDIIEYDKDELENNDYYYDDAVNDTNALWTLDTRTGTVPIPFMIEKNMAFKTRRMIHRAIAEFHNKTCIR